MNTLNSSSGFLTFAELQSSESVNPEIIIRTLDEYVGFGASIVAEVVIALTEKCEVAPNDWVKIMHHATNGARNQSARGHQADSVEYRTLEMYAYRKLGLDTIRQTTTDGVEDVLKTGE